MNNQSFGKCKKCGCDKQTITHILTECSIKEKLDTNDPANVITDRHNSVIYYLVKELKENLADKDTQIYVDLPQHENRYKEFPSDLLLKNTTLRPDIIIKSKDLVVVGELTSPMEWNMKKNNEFKKSKYTKELLPSMKNDVPVDFQPFEISARGVVGESIREHSTFLKLS